MSQGILYIATGKKYVREARVSAESARNQMPDIPRAIITDCDEPGEVFDRVLGIRDPDNSWVDKSDNLHRTPFDRTLYLDTDTYVARPVHDIFDCLDHADFATALEKWDPGDYGLPSSIPVRQTGVIAFKLNDTVRDLLERWRAIFAEARKRGEFSDQPPLTRAVIESDATVHTLPVEDNCLAYYGERLQGPVRIVHGHRPDRLAEVASELNRTERNRVFRSHLDLHVEFVDSESMSRIEGVLFSIRHEGILVLLRRVVNAFTRTDS